MIRVAINGFGRIGRQVYQAGFNDPNIEWVAVNDLTDPKTLSHLLKYDSTQGAFPGEVSYSNDEIIVNGKHIKVFAERDPEKLPWKELNIDVVVEATGFFRTHETASKHITAGAKKVLLSAPAKGDKGADITLVRGVNETMYDKDKHHIISNASCTTNCLAPIVKVLNDNYGVKRGYITTVHSYTAGQNIVDGPNKDLRRARSAAINIVPTSTGAAVAVGLVIPAMKGKLDGYAIRVPTPTGSITDFVVELNKTVTVEEINKLFKSVSENELKGILEYTNDPIVSTDIIHNSHSCIFDGLITKVMDDNFVKIMGWYDNEWGYSNRMVDMINHIMK